MQIVNQILQFLQQGLGAVFRLIEVVWRWSVTQIMAVPWGRLGDLPLYKVAILAITGGVVVYLLYRAAKELWAAGEKALSAFITLLTVIVRTLPPVLLAGVAAAGGAWLVNHVHF
jgi:hypothetical protein